MQTQSRRNMLVLLFAAASAAFAYQGGNAEAARWERDARSVTIVRDDWGIAHIYGKTDADAVFGAVYAQAEDDFNRVETNYINAMGRLAETEGESAIYQDLRMKLFIDPASLKQEYAASPAWLKALMNSFADGLNYYLYKHPEVHPRVIKHFEPWMALSFTEGSIGGDIERVNLKQLQAFYGEPVARAAPPADNHPAEPGGSNGMAVAPSNTASHHALLLINPHTSFFFRSELQMVSDEGLNAYGAVTWGQFFVYQGFNDRAGWMHTSSGVDAVDEYLETVDKAGRRLRLQVRQRGASRDRNAPSPCPTRRSAAWLKRSSRSTALNTAPSFASANGKWVSIRLMQEPVKALTQSYTRTKAKELQGVPPDHGVAHQLVQQHHLRRRRWRHRVFPRQLHPPPRSRIRLDQARGWQQSRHRLARPALGGRNAAPVQPRERLALQLQQLALVRGRAEQPEARRLSRPMSSPAPNRRADCTPSGFSRTRRTSRWTP